MSQQSNNSIDIPGLSDPFEDLLIRSSPVVRGVDFAMRERPEVIGKDKRSTWNRFSDWIFDGVLPGTAPKYRGEGATPEEREARQLAYAKKHGNREFIDKNAGSAERLAADLLVGFADEGQLPMAADPSEDVADDIMMEIARNTLSNPDATPEDRRSAVETVGDRALRQIVQKQVAEGSLADVSNGDDLAKRVVELWADGSTDEEIGKELTESGWDYSKADKKVVDRLGQEIEILNAEGEFGKAMGLGLARLNLMKNGGAADVNTTPYDSLLDEFIRADAANMTKSDAFSIAGTDAFLSTIRGIGRLTGVGYTTPKDKDILEKMTQTAYEEHPVTSLAGSFAGGFVDPVFFAISLGVAKAPVTALQKGKYVDDLVARGTPKSIAAKMGERATLETIATHSLSKYFLNQGLSLKAAQAAGALVWNTTDAALTNGLAEGIVAGGEGASPVEIASRSLQGAGTGIVMGVAFDRAARGIDSISRAIGDRIPKDATKQIDMAISYAAAQGNEGKELSTSLRGFVDNLNETGKKLGRKLTVAEVEQIATSRGIDLGGLAVARTQQIQELKNRKANAKQAKREPGQELSDIEKEAIDRGILKAPEEPLTDAQKQARTEKNNADQDARVVETERIAKELESVPDEELRERYKTAKGAELDAIDLVLAERGALDAEGKKRGIVKDAQNEELTPEQRREKSQKADKKLEDQYGPALDREDAKKQKKADPEPDDEIIRTVRRMSPKQIETGRANIERLSPEDQVSMRRAFAQVEDERRRLSNDFPGRVNIDELAKIEAPTADGGSLENHANFQRSNLENIEHRGDDFVKVRIPIKGIEVHDKVVDPAPVVDKYREQSAATRPPIAGGPSADGSGKFFVSDGARRVMAARANGETEISAYVPEWYAQQEGLSNLPEHLRVVAKKIDGPKKPKTEIIDRTPEGFGPAGSESKGASGSQRGITPELEGEIAKREAEIKRAEKFARENGFDIEFDPENGWTQAEGMQVIAQILDDLDLDASKKIDLASYYGYEKLNKDYIEIDNVGEVVAINAEGALEDILSKKNMDLASFLPEDVPEAEFVDAIVEGWVDSVIPKLTRAVSEHNVALDADILDLPSGPRNLIPLKIRDTQKVQDAVRQVLEAFETSQDGTKIGKWKKMSGESSIAAPLWTYRFTAPKKMAKSAEMKQLRETMIAIGAGEPEVDKSGRLIFRIPDLDGTVKSSIQEYERKLAKKSKAANTPTGSEVGGVRDQNVRHNFTASPENYFGSPAMRPKTGTKIGILGFTGSGRADPSAVYADGAEGPILGPGQYVATTKEAAEAYGPNVSRTNLQLDNPYVIENPSDITQVAGAQIPLDNASRNAYMQDFTNQLKEGGYDGVVVQIPIDTDSSPKGENIKRIRELFGETQAVKFGVISDEAAGTNRPTGKPTPEPRTDAPGNRADEGSDAGGSVRSQERAEERAAFEAERAKRLAEEHDELETGMGDARVWVKKTDDSGKPLSPKDARANRKKVEGVVKKMETIAKSKPSKYRSPSFPKTTKVPVMKPATRPTQVLKDIEKIVSGDGKLDGFVNVVNGGQSADFISSRMVIRSNIGAFGTAEAVNGWAPDGVYKIDKASSKLMGGDFKDTKLPDLDSLFSTNDLSVKFEDIDPQELVISAKRLKVITDEHDAAAVVFQNPDGSIGFGAESQGAGSVSVNVENGATPIGMIDPEKLEKAARIMQRTDNPSVIIEVANMDRSKEPPKIAATSIFKIRGRWSEIVMSGFAPSQPKSMKATGYADNFVSPKPDETSSMSTTGPGPKKPAADDQQLTLYSGTERTTPEGITGHDLETIEGVPGDQMKLDTHNADPQSGVDPGIGRKIPPKWVTDPPSTRGGKKIVGRIKSDPKGMKYGVRSIAEELGRSLDPLLTRQTREQLSSKNPAHYMPSAHMIRTKSASEPNWMFHEQGHAISSIMRESNPRFIKDFKKDLESLTSLPGSMASAPSAEEGFAEFIRRLIVSPHMMEQWGPTNRILGAMESASPKVYESVRDAARAFDAYMQRPLDARWRSYMNDTKSIGGRAKRVLANAMTDYVSRGNAPEFAMRRVMVEVRKDAKTMREGWKAVDKLEGSIKNTAADMMPAYQSLNHIPQMVNVALEGPGPVKKGAPTGMRVHATVIPENLTHTSFDRPRGHMDDEPGTKVKPVMLSDLERSLLKKAGFKVPDEPKQHGDIVVLADKSIADAIEPIKKDEWAGFETYAQMKATVARIKARAMEGESFPYQTQGEGASPIDLIREIKKSESENKHWAGVFDDLEEIMNSTLVLDVMAGELSVKDAIKLKNRFEHYLPLTRQGEGGPRSIKSGATAAPSANIRRSRGSVNPAEPILTAMSRKIDEAINAYYWNRFAMSPILLSASLEQTPGVPRSARIAAKRMGIRLKLDTKKMATASPDEVKKAIYEYIIEEVSRGNELFNMIPEELDSFTPDDIGIVDGFDIWRKVPPKAVNVLAPNINGRRQYFQVLDDNLFRIFTEGGETVNSIARISEQAFGSTTQGLKNQITQTFSFTMRNLFRDSMTAALFGKDPVALVPGFYHAVGAMSMLTKRGADTLVSPELLSRVFREVSTDDFAKQRSKSMEILAEGVVPRGWRDMNMLSKTLTAPGIAVRVLLKPLELKQILTGQRWLASAMETAPRQGAYIMAKRRGLSDEAAQLAADTVTGNFSERPLSSSAHSIYRTAGFLNPAFQIFNQQARFLMDPVPARGALTAATRMGNIAFWTGVAWALNRLAQGPEDRKRNMERTEKERVTHMEIKGLRIPFDYGIPGGVQSYTWNMLDELDGQRGVSGEQIARKMLGEVFPHTSINPLEFAPMALKAGAEAQMGYSLYRGERLEPSYMDYMEAPDRYFDTTPDLYRWVGRMTNSSPIRINYFARNGLGVQLDDMVKLLDRVDEGFRVDELASLPEVGRMFSREPVGWNSRSVRDAATLADEYDALRRRAEGMMESGDVDQEAISEVVKVMQKLEPIKDAMLEIQELYSNAKEASRGDPERSRELKRKMVEVARRGLIEMDELDSKGQ